MPSSKVKVNVSRKGVVKNRLLVVDADIVAYQGVTQFLVEERVNGSHGDEWSYSINEKAFRDEIEARLAGHLRDLAAGDLILCFGSQSNWRKQILAGYKKNRAQKKPLGYSACVEWMRSKWPNIIVPHLEADDVCGLIHTGGAPHIAPSGTQTVLVSEDKDFMTIPGRLYNPRRPHWGIIEVSPMFATWRHMLQTMTGDSSDNYTGCRGIGPKRAEKILKELPGKTVWDTIVQTYEAAGQSESDALTQARVARILHGGEYDFDTGELNLWSPDWGLKHAWTRDEGSPWKEAP